MKKILFFISILGLVGCSSKTVQNNFAEAIKVGDVEVEAGQCAADWGEGFFGLFGDFPLKITKADGEKLHADNEEEYAAAHYVVGADGTVTEAEEACESKDEEEVEADAETALTPGTNADAETAPTPGTNADAETAPTPGTNADAETALTPGTNADAETAPATPTPGPGANPSTIP